MSISTAFSACRNNGWGFNFEFRGRIHGAVARPPDFRMLHRSGTTLWGAGLPSANPRRFLILIIAESHRDCRTVLEAPRWRVYRCLLISNGNNRKTRPAF